MSLFRIKICGVTRPEDAAGIAEAGADAIGLNFYAASPRFVSDDLAAEIIAALPAPVAKIGVFVNADAAAIREKVQRLGLDWVQLHGDEPPEFLAELPGLAVIRAVRLSDWARAVLPAAEGKLVRLPKAVLIDAFSASAYGGTGMTVAWDAIPEARRRLAGLPVILAGGLTPKNVAEAIQAARPDSVDVASGVESSPGVKDLAMVKDFVAASREAFDAREPSGAQGNPGD
jgi:phosphoribosylanthranilate isomerase